LKVGTAINVIFVYTFDTMVIAPGGKLIVKYKDHSIKTRLVSVGAFFKVAPWNIANGDDLKLKRVSMVDTWRVEVLSKYQRY